MGARVSSEWLNSCSGCEISIVDMGERLLDVLQVADIVHLPALVDSKYYGQTGEKVHIDLPEAEVGIISGGIRNTEHLEVAHEMRKKCKIIVALGTCATHGGNPALANSFTNDETCSVPSHRDHRPAGCLPVRTSRDCWTPATRWTRRSRSTSACPAARRTRTTVAALVALVKGTRSKCATRSVRHLPDACARARARPSRCAASCRRPSTRSRASR